MKATPDEIYCAYLNWTLKIGVPPLSRPAYEKALDSISPRPPNNIDVILRSGPKKDK